MRSLLVAVALAVAVAPTAHAKKRRSAPHVTKHMHATRRAPTRGVAVEHVAPTRVAPARVEPAPLPAATAAPAAALPAAAPAPPVARGPAIDQAGDDEVPGTRVKKR